MRRDEYRVLVHVRVGTSGGGGDDRVHIDLGPGGLQVGYGLLQVGAGQEKITYSKCFGNLV